ncbi:MAG: hypothetical protein WC833_08505 [Bacteroidales bacterium]|jgi:hypothetical protein
MEEIKKQKKRTSRIQSGIIHVHFRGHLGNKIFLDDDDKMEFLYRCQDISEIYMGEIFAFVLMDSYAHLIISSDNLTSNTKKVLQGYSMWFNHKHGLSGKVFEYPFNSAIITSIKMIIESTLDILSNPIKLKKCSHPSEYEWSSYHYYFSKSPLMNNFILTQSIYIRKYFKNQSELDSAINNFSEGFFEVTDRCEDTWYKPSDSFVSKHLTLILNERNIFELGADEMEQTIKLLRNVTGASYKQLALLTHSDYESVKKLY